MAILPPAGIGISVLMWIPSPTLADRVLIECSMLSNRWVPAGISAADAFEIRVAMATSVIRGFMFSSSLTQEILVMHVPVALKLFAGIVLALLRQKLAELRITAL